MTRHRRVWARCYWYTGLIFLGFYLIILSTGAPWHYAAYFCAGGTLMVGTIAGLIYVANH